MINYTIEVNPNRLKNMTSDTIVKPSTTRGVRSYGHTIHLTMVSYYNCSSNVGALQVNAILYKAPFGC
jgi:hypothetical protein